MKNISVDFAMILAYDLKTFQFAYNFNSSSLSLIILIKSKQNSANGKQFITEF